MKIAEFITESNMVLTMKSVWSDQEVYDRLNILKRAGIEADVGSRSSQTDIIIDSHNKDKAISLLTDAGYTFDTNGHTYD